MLVPPNFDPAPNFPEAQAIGAALRSAISEARPGGVVYSTIGAQATQWNLLSQHTIIEQALGDSRYRLRSCVRDGSWRTPHGMWRRRRESGVIPGFLQPLDKPVPNGLHSRHRPSCRGIDPGNVERQKSGGTGRTTTRDACRDRGHFSRISWVIPLRMEAVRHNGGSALKIAGHGRTPRRASGCWMVSMRVGLNSETGEAGSRKRRHGNQKCASKA